MTKNPIFCAFDMTDGAIARQLAGQLAGAIGGIKLGLEFFTHNGPEGVRAVMRGTGLPLFLDLKFHDIPNTVAGAVRAILPLEPAFTTIHAAGGLAMMRAAVDAAAGRTRILAVTVLTSLCQDDLRAQAIAGMVSDHVRRLAALAQTAGAAGLVCSPHEVALLRADCGPDFTLMVPGIRPKGAVADDQARVLTPAEALQAGADYLVIGRPITAAADPATAARLIAESMETQ